MHLPADGQADPANIALALAKGARPRGARIVENVKVTAVTRATGRVTGVDWEADGERGHIAAEHVVNCGGMWGRDLAAAERRDPAAARLRALLHRHRGDRRPRRSCRCCGSPTNAPTTRRTRARSCSAPSSRWRSPGAWTGIREDFCFDQLPEDFDHFEPILEMAINRMPMLAEAGIHTFFNGPESFTPDDRYYLGEAPELGGYWVAAGYNSIGIASSGGAGMALAQWMEDGAPPFDLWEVDIRRAQPFQRNRRYLRERVSETLGLLYADHFPYRQMATARGVRRSPLHEQLKARGAVFGEAAGWERANWFAEPGAGARVPLQLGPAELVREPARRAYGLAERRRAPRHDLLRQDPGRGSRRPRPSCSWLCANEIDVADGRIVYTQMLNAAWRHRGGPDGDAARRDGVPPRGAGRDAAARPRLAASARRRARRCRSLDVTRGRGGDAGDGAEGARPPARWSRPTISPTRRIPSAPPARSRSAWVSPALIG